ncbi:Multiple antibiotic resistance protein MarA [compost metagenome]
MPNISAILKHLYQSTLIPVYHYNKDQLVEAYPQQGQSTLPPLEYLVQLSSSQEQVAYLSTSFFAYYGMIKIVNSSDSVIIVGPVSQIPYLKDTFRILKKEFVISEHDQPRFEAFMRLIPPMQLQQFLNHLVTINYFINEEEIRYSDLLELDNMRAINAQQAEKMYQNKENLYFNNSYEIENQMCACVENGNEAGLYNFIEQPFMTHEGILAKDSHRQAKNTSIVTITVITRAAIRGGLETEVAYQLSDLYIQQIEQLLTLEEIQIFTKEALFNFTRRVSEVKYNLSETGNMRKIIHYVYMNINRPITATHLAEHFGYSRTYLSTVFKKNTGISLHQFILDCKLDEAKNLLKCTDKPISEISNYLCFSSQSHFQTVFKNAYQQSPLNYRKQNQITKS